MFSGIFLIPLYIRYVDSNLYGYWLALYNVVGWLAVFDPSASTVIQQKVAFLYGKKEYSSIMSYIFFGLLISIFISLLIFSMGLCLSLFLPELLNYKGSSIGLGELRNTFVLSIYGTSIIIFSFALSACTMGLQSIVGTGWASFLSNFGGLLFTVCLITHGKGLESIGWGFVFRGVGYSILNGGLLFYLIYKIKIPFTININLFKPIINLMSFNYLGSISNVFLNSINSFIIVHFLGSNYVSIYSLTKSSFDICAQLLIRPSTALIPTFSHLIGEGNLSKGRVIFFSFSNYLVWLLGCAFCGLFLLNKTFVGIWVGISFFAGDIFNAFLAVNMFFVVIFTSLVNFLTSFSRFRRINKLIFFQALLYLPLSLLFLFFHFFEGIVIANIISIMIFPIRNYQKWLWKRLQIKQEESMLILKELFIVLICISLTCFIFVLLVSNVNLPNLSMFVFQILFVISIYFLLLFMVSKKFSIKIKESVSVFIRSKFF